MLKEFHNFEYFDHFKQFQIKEPLDVNYEFDRQVSIEMCNLYSSLSYHSSVRMFIELNV